MPQSTPPLLHIHVCFDSETIHGASKASGRAFAAAYSATIITGTRQMGASSAYRRPSMPNEGVSKSLRNPTHSGPSPKPSIAVTNILNAVAVARISAGTTLIAVAITGPFETLQ